ncbi:MAG: D-lyxose/D-mannose family sugar isomerase [Clostridiaceae bacterium]|jgi:D-lyxose ketol-isomerase|nr:D-lyxose/D-mannose family sugar isomerase [Clostridiaceae bacterium]HOA32788.1 D-lyxose/D-mannose family sugar isomerase [Clostridia bacterium]
MKRSEVNAILKENIGFIKKMNFNLPPFAYWSPEEWETKGHEADEIRDNMLGWDITDYGKGDFWNYGLVLFTIRNGSVKDPRYKKPYAEKILISDENQYNPIHYHWHKMEDIINRGGGNLLIKVWKAAEDDGLSEEDVEVSIDGCIRTVKAGSVIRLTPGESITLPPYLYHEFWAEEGKGKVLIGEVSMVNDDKNDNRFYEDQPRFPTIVEDEKPLYYLCFEYPKAK